MSKDHENQQVNDAGAARDPFAPRGNLTPAKPGGDWDAGAETELENLKTSTVEDVEEQAWADDPDAEDEEIAARDFDDENQDSRQPEGEEEPEAEAAPEA